jgi:predicted HTH transcriptional regulator
MLVCEYKEWAVDSMIWATGMPAINRMLVKTIRGEEKTGEITREKILRLIQERPRITTEELSSVIAVSPKGIEWNLKKLKEEGVIRRVGAAKGGYWEVMKDQQP